MMSSLQFFQIFVFLSCLHFPFFPFRSNQRCNSAVSAVQLKRRSEGEIKAAVSAVHLKRRAGRTLTEPPTDAPAAAPTDAPAAPTDAPAGGPETINGDPILTPTKETEMLEKLFKNLRKLSTWDLAHYKWNHFHQGVPAQEETWRGWVKTWIKKLKKAFGGTESVSAANVWIWSLVPWPAKVTNPDPAKSNMIYPFPGAVLLVDQFVYNYVDTQNDVRGIKIGGDVNTVWRGAISKPVAASVVADLSDVRSFVDQIKGNSVMEQAVVQKPLVPIFNDHYEKWVCEPKTKIISPIALILLDRFIALISETSQLPLTSVAQTSPKWTRISILDHRKNRKTWKESFESPTGGWKTFTENVLGKTNKKTFMDKVIFGLKNEVLGLREVVRLKHDLYEHDKDTRGAAYDVFESAVNSVTAVGPAITPLIRAGSNVVMDEIHFEHYRTENYRTYFLDAVDGVLDKSLTYGDNPNLERNLKVIGGLMLLLNYWRKCSEVLTAPDTKEGLLTSTSDKIFAYREVVKTWEAIPSSAGNTYLGVGRDDVTRAVLIYEGLNVFLKSTMPNHFADQADLVKGYAGMGAKKGYDAIAAKIASDS